MESEDMKSIKFVVPGKPFGKQRPRFSKVGSFVKPFTPKETVLHERAVADAYRAASKGYVFPKGTPLDVRVIAYYPIPQSTSKKKWQRMIEHYIRPVVKPDLDNVLKLAMDALNGVAWHDDNAIVDEQARKFYSDEPRLVITIRVVEGMNI